MKKEFNIKLTAFLVSLFIGLLLIILGNKNKYCLGFGLIVLGISLGLYMLYKIEIFDGQIRELMEKAEELTVDQWMEKSDSNRDIYKIRKQKGKMSFLFGFTGFALIVLGFVCML